MGIFHNAILLSYFLLGIGVTPIVVGTIVLVKGRDENSLFYFFLALSISVWASALALFEIFSEPTASTMFLNIYFIGANAIVVSLAYLALSFSALELTIRRVVLIALPALIFSSIISYSGNIFTILAVEPNSFGKSFTYLPVFPVNVAFLILYLGMSVYLLYKKYFNSAGVYRAKEKVMFYVVVLCSAIAAISNLILPLFGYDQFFFVGGIFVVGGVYFFGYIMAARNLWDLKILSTQIFDSIIVVALGVSILFSDTVEQYVLKSFFFLLVATTAIYLYRSMQKEVKAEARVEELLDVLTKRHEALASLDRRTSVFVTTTANQLRDPLSGIRWHASSLLQGAFGPLPERSREYVERIFESGKRLIAIVDDFLDLREIEQGKMSYEFLYFDMKPMVRSVVEETTPLASEKNLVVTYSDDEKSMYPVHADQGKIRQVVSNLIDNAIKYSEQGDIRVRLQMEADSITVAVADCGIGLEPTEIKSLFRKFSRMREAKKVNAGGSGLGLYIASVIARAHGGEVFATSKGSGKGSTFSLKLPKNTKK